MIYLIDDDVSIRRSLGVFLKSAGHEYISLASAEEYLSHYKLDKKDLIILDLNMPGMSGYDLLKKFDEEGTHIPVIVVTAFDEPHSRECCKKYGVLAYLRKPLDGEALLDLINFNTASETTST